jgi:hypothetical protein
MTLWIIHSVFESSRGIDGVARTVWFDQMSAEAAWERTLGAQVTLGISRVVLAVAEIDESLTAKEIVAGFVRSGDKYIGWAKTYTILRERKLSA